MLSMKRTPSTFKLFQAGLQAPSWHAIAPRGALRAYYDWMAHVGSLTARLRASSQRFSVQVLRQQLQTLSAEEAATLGLRRGAQAWVREVLLHCDGRPVVFAHSVVPQKSVRGAWHLFAGLGARPLGEILFSDPLITRCAFQFARLDARHHLHRHIAVATGISHNLAARRSLFIKRQQPMLLVEVFLPEVLQLKPIAPVRST